MQLAVKVFIIAIFLFTALYSQEVVLKVGTPAPDIQFSRLSDNANNLMDWNNIEEDVVLIDFWATWCAPCIKSIPHLNELSETFADSSVAFISLTYEPPHMITPFLRKHPLKTMVASDADFATFKAYNAWGIPMVAIVNSERKIAAVVHPSNLSANMIQEILAGKIPVTPQAKPWPDPAGAEEYFRSLIKPQPTK